MAKFSFRDPVTNVLKAYGYCQTNQAGDVQQEESEDFNLKPSEGWQWNGSAWIPYAFPEPTSDQKFNVYANPLFQALIKELAARFGVTPLQLITSIKSRI